MYGLNKTLFSVIFLLLTACAAVNTPNGGPRDTIKPQLKATEPKSGTTNFTGRTIKLTFDEDVRTKDINQQLIITPNTDNTYTAKQNNQEIIIEFNKNLEPNTTYFLNFREGIEDVHEGNKAEAITLNFSTGEQLDTGMVKGTVKDYLTGKPQDNFTVALYPLADTNNIRDHKPYYYTKSMVDGSFTLSNIKKGDYWIFAHQDKNNNEYYDQQNEKIAYLPIPIKVDPVADSVKLKTVYVDTQKPYAQKTENFAEKNTVTYNEGIKSFELKSLEPQPKPLDLVIARGPDGKRIDIFAKDGKLPERALAFTIDSAGNKGVDTLKLSLSSKKSFPDKLTYRTKNGDLQITNQDKIGLEFSVPMQIFDNQPFTIVQDSTKKSQPQKQVGYAVNESSTVITFNTPVIAKKTVQIIVDTTKIKAINGKAFNSQNITYRITEKANTGSLSGQIKTQYKNYKLELLNEQGKIINEFNNPVSFSIPELNPGTYQLRVKIDENNDGKWTTGDPKLKNEPEKVYVYPKPITVRANWEIADIILIF